MATAERHKIFVGSLPSDCTQEELKIVFSTYGNPIDIHIMSGQKSSSGQACAFIIYDRYDSAETAIATLDNVYCIREDGSLPIRVSWARPGGPSGGEGAGASSGPRRPLAVAAPIVPTSSPWVAAAPARKPQGSDWYQSPSGAPPAFVSPAVGNAAAAYAAASIGARGGDLSFGGVVLPPPPPPDPAVVRHKSKLFVGNLPPDISQEAIHLVFSTYGTVTNIHIMTGKAKSGQSCAFVEYAAPVEAETAVLTLHDKYEIRPGDGCIMVKYANLANRTGPY